jgi:hypothetical protein
MRTCAREPWQRGAARQWTTAAALVISTDRCAVVAEGGQQARAGSRRSPKLFAKSEGAAPAPASIKNHGFTAMRLGNAFKANFIDFRP